MASITVRNLDGALKQRLRIRAAEHGRSIEEEAREILRRAVGEAAPPSNLAAAIHARIAPLGGVDLDLPPREPMREPPTLDRLRAWMTGEQSSGRCESTSTTHPRGGISAGRMGTPPAQSPLAALGVAAYTEAQL